MEIELNELQKEAILSKFVLIEEPYSQFISKVNRIMDDLLNEEIINIWDHDLVDRYDEYKELVVKYLKDYLKEKDGPYKCSVCHKEIEDESLMIHIVMNNFIHTDCENQLDQRVYDFFEKIKDGTWY
jgi:hypothetical protein